MADNASGRRLRLSSRELRGQLIVLVGVLWLAAVINAATPTRYLRTGQVKGTDFVQYYTLATLVATGHAGQFWDAAAQRRLQLTLVPESSDEDFAPAYGPQVALLLSGLSYLSYGQALLVWISLSALTYFGLIALVVRRSQLLRAHTGLVLLAACGYPPFWFLIQHGQLSVIALAAVVGSWLAWRRGFIFAAGAALGILGFKPSLLVPMLVILALGGEWRVCAGAMLTGVAQVLATVRWVGFQGLRDYVALSFSWAIAGPTATVSDKPMLMHSWRGFWPLLIPNTALATWAYLLSAGVTLIVAAWLWRSTSQLSLRFAILLMATALASPHIYVYDLVILAPAWLWLTEWYIADKTVPAWVGGMLYMGYLAPLLTLLTELLRVQCLTPILAILLFWLYRHPPAAQLPVPVVSGVRA